MEEDIKILKNVVKTYEEEAIHMSFRGTLSIYIDEDDIQAIENLIKGYRELEEYIKRLDELNARDFILKSTIEEKIEEYKIKIQKTAYTQERRNRLNCKIQVLQELMEDK
jgi:tRNA(Ser,Leu) C12 N-acetylase TAN1